MELIKAETAEVKSWFPIKLQSIFQRLETGIYHAFHLTSCTPLGEGGRRRRIAPRYSYQELSTAQSYPRIKFVLTIADKISYMKVDFEWMTILLLDIARH